MKRFIVCLAGIAVFASLAMARTNSSETGTEIMKKVLSQSNWEDMSGDLIMTLTTSRGETRVRNMKFYSKKKNENESMMLIKIISPADVRGTAFLTIEHQNRDDDRYLYLPALRRVKKITASGKGGNFMSSDFTYYDMGKPKLKDWTYKRVADETVDGHPCFVVEAVAASPKIAKETGYSKIVRWIRKDTYTTLKSIFYDRDGKKWKELSVPDVKKINGVWFSTVMVMHDVQIDHTSKMEFKELKINTGIPAKYFSVRYLQRGQFR